MAVLFTPQIQGVGTPNAESLLSLLHRTASIYNVPLSSVSRLIVRVSAGGPSPYKGYDSTRAIMSHTPTTARLLAGLQIVTGKTEAVCTTLMKLQSVLDMKGRDLLASNIRWCPDCLHPDTGTSYGLLAHQLVRVLHCPIHNAALNDRCLSCGCAQNVLHASPSCRHCRKCNAPLWNQRRVPPNISRYASWCEEQVLLLVAYLSDPDSAPPEENWRKLYLHGMTRLSESTRKQYTPKELRFVREQMKCLSKGMMPRPRLDSLLRAAAIQAVTIVDMVIAPIESCSPRLFNIGGANDPCVSRRDHSESEWLLLKDIVEKLMETDKCVLLPSKRSLFRGTGLTPSGFWQHFPDLSVNYEVERKRRTMHDRGERFHLTLKAAEQMISSRLTTGKDVQVRRDGKILMDKFGVSKANAERAINAALVTNDIFRELKLTNTHRIL